MYKSFVLVIESHLIPHIMKEKNLCLEALEYSILARHNCLR